MSILISVFEYTSSRQFNKEDGLIVIKFDFESAKIANMNGLEFRDKVAFTRNFKLIHLMCKTIHVTRKQVERMMPVQSNQGVKLSFIIDSDAINFDYIWALIVESVKNGNLRYQLKKVYKVEDNCEVPMEKLLQFRVIDNASDENAALRLETVGTNSSYSGMGITASPSAVSDYVGTSDTVFKD